MVWKVVESFAILRLHRIGILEKLKYYPPEFLLFPVSHELRAENIIIFDIRTSLKINFIVSYKP